MIVIVFIMMKFFAKYCYFIFFCTFGINTYSSTNSVKSFEVEGGVLQTNNMEIYGYQQESATKGWKSNEPTVRLEFWKRSNKWNFGTVFQPLYSSYSGKLSSDLNYNDKIYSKGDNGTLKYQFHTIRQTANYPVLNFVSGGYLRLGASLVARYAQLDFTTNTNSFHSKNFIVLPLLNYELSIPISSRYSFFSRADFLPSPTDNLFLDGLYDCLFALKYKLNNGRSIDGGIRLFFGGYDPKTPNDYANKIFFNAFVLRYNF